MNNEYRIFPKGKQREAIDYAEEYLPDEAELALLSYTGGRAFGWGNERHDIDVHGFFVMEDWFNRVHASVDIFDMTITNIYSFENPDFYKNRWKNYYDKGNPIYIHDNFDFDEDFMDHCSYDTVENIFPFDLNIQVQRLDVEFRDRNALHTYKELLIPINYLENDEIRSDVVNDINSKPEYQYPGLEQCVRSYRDGENIELDEELIWSEIEELQERLEENLIEKANYEPKNPSSYLSS